MLQSNFLCDNRIFAYFGPQLDEHNFNHAGVVLFQCHLHRCKTSSMSQIQHALEEFRSDFSILVNDNDDDLTASNPFSTLICQLNERSSTRGQALVERVIHTDISNNNNVILGETCKSIESRSAYNLREIFHVIFLEIKSSSIE